MKKFSISFVFEAAAIICCIGSAIHAFQAGTDFGWQVIAAVWIFNCGFARVMSEKDYARYADLLSSANTAIECADELITMQQEEIIRLRGIIKNGN